MNATLQRMKHRRIQDAADVLGFTPIVGRMTLGRSALGTRPQRMLAVYRVGNDWIMNPGWVEGQEIQGTGKITLSEGRSWYLSCQVSRERSFWYQPPGEELDPVYYYTGDYTIGQCKLIESDTPPPDDLTDPENVTTHRFLFKVTSSFSGYAGRTHPTIDPVSLTLTL